MLTFIDPEDRIFFEIVFKSYDNKAKFEAQIQDTIQIKDIHVQLKCQNRGVKELRREECISVAVYEAPFELEDRHIKRDLGNYGTIKGTFSRHKHKGTVSENGSRSVLFYEHKNIPTTL